MAATTPQINFARDLYRTLRDEREVEQSVLDEFTQRVEKHRNDSPGEFSDSVIGWAIEQRDNAPRVTITAEIADGRYAIEDEDRIRFFKVNTPESGKWQGFTFVEEQASDDLYPVRNPDRRKAILDEIAKDPEAATILYGKELGVCGVCGRTLTSEWRKKGIGPVCATK